MLRRHIIPFLVPFLYSARPLPAIPRGAKPKARRTRPSRQGIKTQALIRLCPGRRHAWFASAAGPVRKPINA